MSTEFLYAFDLSMTQTGLTIFDLTTFSPLIVTSFPTKDSWSHGKRLNQIYTGIHQYTEQYPPSVVAIERMFSRFNNATQVIARTHGLVNWMMKDLDQFYYTPKTVKEAIVSGNASKDLLLKKVQAAYPDLSFQNTDESDSFCVGLTYMIKEKGMVWNKSMQKVKKSPTKPRKKKEAKVVG